LNEENSTSGFYIFQRNEFCLHLGFASETFMGRCIVDPDELGAAHGNNVGLIVGNIENDMKFMSNV